MKVGIRFRCEAVAFGVSGAETGMLTIGGVATKQLEAGLF